MTEFAVTPSDVDVPERELEEHRAELTGFCYRMLGSPFEAEDAVQETLVRAWRALDRFERRAALRSWLFGIATNVCIDMLHARGRRALPMELGPPSQSDAPLGAPLPEHVWVGPILDDGVLGKSGDPADVAIARESIRLAFVVALQHLTAKQRAALLLHDVLRWKAKEVAKLLDTSTASVESLLRRARAVLDDTRMTGAVPVDTDASRALVDRYVDAFARYDVNALVALLHEDVTLSMPPYPLWLRGVDAVRTWLTINEACRDVRFSPVAINDSPGLALYKRAALDGPFEAFGLQVIEQSNAKISAIQAFLEPRLFFLFGLPRTLPG